MAYDTSGNLASITDPVGRILSYGYDARGRVTSQTLPDGRVVTMTYDANGNITSITPPSKPAHGFAYTPVNLESAYNPPAVTGSGATVTTYAYNLDKQLTTATRPDGKVVNYSYDTAGRLSGMASPDGNISYTYGSNSCPSCGGGEMPQSVASAIGGVNQTINYGYDGALLTSAAWNGAINGSVSWTYNNDMRPITQSVNGANTVNFGYDNDGNLSSAGAMTITRNPGNGIITGTTLGSATTSATHSSYGELATSTAKYGANTLLNMSYSRDNLGRITRKVETVGVVATTYDYAYDTAGRLVGVSKNGVASSSYVYDNNGNRITATQSGIATQGFYDLQDRLITYGNNSYTYTANGELLTKTSNGQSTLYNYDVMGNLVSVTMPDGTLIEYVIDGTNRRIGKKVNGTLVQGWIYKDQLKPVAELDGGGSVVATFVYGTKVHSPDYIVKNGVTYRVISDHLGSPRMIVDTTTGALVQAIDYDEWGNVVSDTNPGFQPFAYVGGIYDKHTKFTRFGVRDYDTETGRWTAKDPILFAGKDTSIYIYVSDDPINKYDLNGMYGTSNCSYYKTICEIVNDVYHCYIAQIACDFFPKTGDWSRCTRQCLQDYDQRYCHCGGGASTECISYAHVYCWIKCLKNSDNQPPFPSEAPLAW